MATDRSPSGVTGREAEVLAALAQRLSNAQIAHRLHLSIRTVESHVSSLLRKFGATDRHALVELAGVSPAGDLPPSPGEVRGLPVARTSFVGRVSAREELVDVLRRDQLVTLLGPGGVGKTRLAAAAAEAARQHFPSGGTFVDLVPVRDPFVPEAVAAVLGLTERPQQPLVDAVIDRLGRGRWLLVLDNCEHLADTVAAFVETLLTAAPAVTVLLTSRERLGLPGERVVSVAPLALGSEAEELFRDRAAAVAHDLPADQADVAQLCARLNGMPLAIELAAARAAALGTAGVLAALDAPLAVLSGGRGSDPRHRSMRAVIVWSHDLLDDPERALLHRLAVFVGDFNLVAAAAVTGIGDLPVVADVLGRLVDKCLVTRRSGSGRWRMLDTVRAFASERLDASGERAEVQDRWLRWAEETAAELERRLDGQWRDDFDAVADELRAALAAAQPGPGAVAHRLARALGRLTYARRFLIEACGHYRRAATHAADPAEASADLTRAAECTLVATTSGPDVVELLLAAANQARAADDGNAEAIALARVVELASRAEALFPVEISHRRLRSLLDRAVAAGDAHQPAVAARLALAATWIAVPEKHNPDPELARAAYEAASAAGDPVLVSAGLDALHTAATRAGRLREAARLTRQRFPVLATVDRTDPYPAPEIQDAHHTLAGDALQAGDLVALLSASRNFMADDLLGGDSYVSSAQLVQPLVLTGDLHAAIEHAAAAWDGWQRAGRPPAGAIVSGVVLAALAHALLGDHRAYLTWRSRAGRMAGITDARLDRLASTCVVDVRAAVHTGDMSAAPTLVERAFGEFRGARYRAYAPAAGAELAVVAGLHDAADRITAATRAAEGNAWAAACLARAAGRLHGDRDALAESIAGWERIGARVERACTLLLLPDRISEATRELAELGVCTPPV